MIPLPARGAIQKPPNKGVAGGRVPPSGDRPCNDQGLRTGGVAAIILIIAGSEQTVICLCGLDLWSEAIQATEFLPWPYRMAEPGALRSSPGAVCSDAAIALVGEPPPGWGN